MITSTTFILRWSFLQPGSYSNRVQLKKVEDIYEVEDTGLKMYNHRCFFISFKVILTHDESSRLQVIIKFAILGYSLLCFLNSPPGEYVNSFTERWIIYLVNSVFNHSPCGESINFFTKWWKLDVDNSPLSEMFSPISEI